MNTEQLLEFIDESKEYQAYLLLSEKCPTAARRFYSLTKALTKLREDVRKEFPDAEYYTGSGGFNLLLGESHTDESPNQKLCAVSAVGLHVGDGDW
ncbi:Uncharacterised protein [Yersinia pseudotuberculosis]|uniref:hypothetical protein n=1 Tax=Yersinia pseudotuberculosis TaxID=633 RepID=UPI0005E63358|nr:hypothetical protein [Yersinia pseudotuberculosis]CNL19336.1 Uncharacterised protein [Yersinia pseudotuberculosis]